MTSKLSFDSLVTAGKLTKAGADWLRAALDPFSDEPIVPEGFPDLNTNNSMVQVVNHSVSITAPGAATWDMVVAMLPVASYETVYVESGVKAGENLVQFDSSAPSNQTEIGFIVVVKAPTGTSMFPWNAAFYAAGGSVTAYPAYNANDVQRIIAGGFEIVNTTSALYLGGSVSIAQIAGEYGDGSYYFEDTAGAPVFHDMCDTVRRIRSTPKYIDDLTQVPNAVTWEAKRGAYVPLRYTSFVNTPGRCVGAGISIEGSEMAVPNDAGGGGWPKKLQPAMPPFGMSIAFLTGLTAESTFRLTYRVYVERFPALDLYGLAEDLLPTSTPSPAYDEPALRMYAALARNLPVACPQDMNPKGEWFRTILGTLNTAVSALTPIATMIDPLAGVVFKGASMGLNVADNVAARIIDVNHKAAVDRLDRQLKAIKVQQGRRVRQRNKVTRQRARNQSTAPLAFTNAARQAQNRRRAGQMRET